MAGDHLMRDLLDELSRLQQDGPVGRAVVTSVWGSAPRPEGACLFARTDGAMVGSVSGGCVEGATVEEIGIAILRGTPRLIRFGVSDETAWSVGLACGGTIEVFVEPTVRQTILDAAKGPGGTVVASLVAGPAPLGTCWVFDDNGHREGPIHPPDISPEEANSFVEILAGMGAEIEPYAREGLARQSSFATELEVVGGEPVRIFLEVFPRQPRLIIIGGVHIATTLVPLAKRLGFHVTVTDGRSPFLTRDRFPEADELILAYPEAAFSQAGIDRATYICILSHDPKFDEPALEIALRSPAIYVGAIGSRKTQAIRREKLMARGLSEEQVARLHGPIGLDLGGRGAAEIALSIIAEMTMSRYNKHVTESKRK
ncbi:MAG: XdhC family protein [Gemmatimonadota bacterium]